MLYCIWYDIGNEGHTLRVKSFESKYHGIELKGEAAWHHGN